MLAATLNGHSDLTSLQKYASDHLANGRQKYLQTILRGDHKTRVSTLLQEIFLKVLKRHNVVLVDMIVRFYFDK